MKDREDPHSKWEGAGDRRQAKEEGVCKGQNSGQEKKKMDMCLREERVDESESEGQQWVGGGEVRGSVRRGGARRLIGGERGRLSGTRGVTVRWLQWRQQRRSCCRKKKHTHKQEPPSIFLMASPPTNSVKTKNITHTSTGPTGAVATGNMLDKHLKRPSFYVLSCNHLARCFNSLEVESVSKAKGKWNDFELL